MENEDGYRFTPRAAQVMLLAEREAQRLNHNFVGTEHLLLGIVRLGDESSAAQVLKALCIDLAQIKTETESQLGQGPDQKLIGPPPLTPRFKKVLALADRERTSHGHTYLGTEHILLGILREGDGVAARVLKKLGVDLQKVRELCPSDLTTPKTTKEPALTELFAAAEELLENPNSRLRTPPRVLAALCGKTHSLPSSRICGKR